MRKGFIYKITSPNGKIYIGETIDIKKDGMTIKNSIVKINQKYLIV